MLSEMNWEQNLNAASPRRVCGTVPHVWRVPPGLTFDEWGTCEDVVCGVCGLRMKRTEARHADGGLVSEPVKSRVTL